MGGPLICPCGCRGSMRVHAQCLQQWLQQRRRSTTGSDEVPRCDICGEPYLGEHETPGIGGFMLRVCTMLCRAIICIMSSFLYVYVVPATENFLHWPWHRIMIIAAFHICVGVLACCILASFPPMVEEPHPPPNNRCLQK